MLQNSTLAVSEITIQRLSPEEWPAYKRIRLDALKSEPMAFGASYERALAIADDEWRQRLVTADKARISKLLFAKDAESNVVGMIGSGISEDGATASVYAMFVTASARGLGVASRLLEALIAEIEACPEITTVTLTVNQSQAAAISLYEKFGLKRMKAIRETMGDDKEHDAWVMSKAGDAD